mgnify:FL=1
MKKAIRWIFAIIAVLLLAVIVTGVVLTVMIHEKRDVTDPAVAAKKRGLRTVLNSHMEADLTAARESGEARFLFSEQDLKFLFYAILQSIDPPSGVTLSGVDVTVADGVYTLAVSARIGVMPTVLRAGLSFAESAGSYSVTLTQASAGSLEVVHGLGRLILRRADAAKIEQSLASVNLFCMVNLDTMTVTFTKENILRTAATLTGGEEDATLLHLLLDVFLDHESLLSLSLGNNNLLGAVLHLARIRYSTEERGALPYTYDFDAVARQVETLLAAGLVTEEQVSPVFRLLVKGYASLSDQDKAALEGVDLTSVGVTDKETYRGMMEKEQRSLSDLLTNDQFFLSSGALLPTFGVKITDDMLTEVLRSMDFVGFSLVFSGADTGRVAYVVIEQFNLLATENHIDLEMIVNINGVQTVMTAALSAPPAAGVAINAKVDSVMLGEEPLTEAQRRELLTYLASAAAGVDFIAFNAEEETVTLRFAEAIAGLSELQRLCETYPMFAPQAVIENGVVTITYRAKI